MFIGKYIQRIAYFTMIVFISVILMGDDSFARQENTANEMRLKQSQEQKMTKETPKEESITMAKTAQTEISSPRVNEKEGANPKMGKKKKFPILLVALGVGVVVGLILMLGKKKNDPKPPTPEPATATYVNGVLTVKGMRYELAAISAGTFQMGSNSPEAAAEEKPVHSVRISQGFWLGKTEVTQGLWKVVMGNNPSNFQNGDNYPVEKVSWDDCQRFIAKLNQMTGKNSFRLPTEAEWEYACRAGTTGERYGDLDAVAWYLGNSGNLNHPVAQKQPNGWGLYDTLGNVDEWCSDWWSETYYSQSPSVDPQGPSSGTEKVLRGGDSFFEAEWSRAAFRIAAEPSHLNMATGLRLAAVLAGN